ncbi:hypothetical protein N7517_007803 [Penicillium concentricum]|uniref:Uncharacterized protein n=1 Tax=Penicillium concentricum TaxID=293559 RepID=A0A9W9SCV4_9EURO|nr:uncharacterized protein N7517_007803 [Penicillium concentricum]KAJ5375797.1 hypothetical protein N7517_007803 [Penicillium concentricum]
MTINPYKARGDEVKCGCLYRDELTVDAAQGRKAFIVIVLLTKPYKVSKETRFIAKNERVNVAEKYDVNHWQLECSDIEHRQIGGSLGSGRNGLPAAVFPCSQDNLLMCDTM